MADSVIFFGIFVVCIGLFLKFGGGLRLPLLPGDIFVKNERGMVYFPIVSSIVISIVLTIIINLFR